jgi:ABC-type uncharacterized transport system substrate-binding protein
MSKKIAFAAMIIFTVGSLGVVNAQPTAKISKIGVLADFSSPQLDALRQGLRDLGYIEGQNLFIDYRYAEGKYERIPELVAELLGLKIDLILTSGPITPIAAKNIKGYRLFSHSVVIRSKPDSSRVWRGLEEP